MMVDIGHSFDSSCLLHSDSNAFTRRASQVSVGPPPLKAHYFYCSSLPIDDPLFPVPPPNNSSPKSAKNPPRPFSVHDNRALEEAWLRIHKPFRSLESIKKPFDEPLRSDAQENDAESRKLGTVSKMLKGSQNKKGGRKSNAHIDTDIRDSRRGSTDPRASVAETKEDINFEEQANSMHSRSPGTYDNPQLDVPHSVQTTSLAQVDPITRDEIKEDESKAGLIAKSEHIRTRSHRADENRIAKAKQSGNHEDRNSSRDRGMARTGEESVEPQELGVSPPQRHTTGTPFIRIPARLNRSRSPSRSHTRSAEDHTILNHGPVKEPSAPSSSHATLQKLPRSEHLRNDSQVQEYESSKKIQEAKVPVGVSRLHVVEMPTLKMGPIYWDPVHDVSSVVRGTWFYKETMFPVESDLANQLEEGYTYIKPWTTAYQDELNSCIEVGPEAELRVAHKIWPSEETQQDLSLPVVSKDDRGFLAVPGETQGPSEETKQVSAVKAAGKAENRASGALDGFNDAVRLFARSSIIFTNGTEGQILGQGQLPSVARGRKPLARIRKGQPVGVTVVRGFDHKAWEKKHPPKTGPATKQVRNSLQGMRAATATSNGRKQSCAACVSAEETSPVTDLVLVVHGIGQKLSERVESFHFTHAINAFRRSVNLELQSDAIKPWLRPSLGSIMVLPVNWRSKMSLSDSETETETSNAEHEDPLQNQYSLRDITAESLPAVRNLISDVMLDIPYYLSHHKPKMIEAVVKEANRIYRLWCLNNPNFQKEGKVHLVAHSLGSVMALDILSKQPTSLPEELEIKITPPRSDMLEFDTKSLFFCGSPAGFFLLLNRAPLVPRRGRDKPGAEMDDIGNKSVTRESGVYGCLAVDNLYNILHQNDPVAYRMNACVDVGYSESLQQAFVPSASASWGQYFGAMLRGRPSTPAKPLDSMPPRPIIAKLPSTVELETHDFTREELAEKRMFLLNDNGQIDYTLKSGGGPLEIQYFNMLSAHSSYWILQDFVRFLVVEIGRKAGKKETVSSFKAIKKPWSKKSKGT